MARLHLGTAGHLQSAPLALLTAMVPRPLRLFPDHACVDPAACQCSRRSPAPSYAAHQRAVHDGKVFVQSHPPRHSSGVVAPPPALDSNALRDRLAEDPPFPAARQRSSTSIPA